VCIELRARHRKRLLERLLQLGAHARECCALLLALRREPLGIGRKSCFDVGDQTLLLLRDLGDTRLRGLACPVEVLRPRRMPLLDLCLRYGQRLRQRGNDFPLALGELGATLLSDLALFVHEQRDRVCTRARQCPLQRLRAVGCFAVDERVQLACASFRCESIRSARRARRAPRRTTRGDRARGERQGRDSKLAFLPHRGINPGDHGGSRDEPGDDREHGATDGAHGPGAERDRREDDAHGAGDLERGRQ
jgi:hypothetical protein